MTDSSPEREVVEGQEPEAPKADDKQGVPVAAVAKERAEKRAARAEADGLREQLEKVQGQDFDVNELVKGLSEVVQQTASAAVEDALKPARDEVTKYKTALKHGLNEDQANEVQSVMDKYSGMPVEEALTLAKQQKPDLFQAQTGQPSTIFDPAVHQGLPVSGDSPNRLGGDEDRGFMDKIKEAKSDNERTFYAMKEFERRIMRARRG